MVVIASLLRLCNHTILRIKSPLSCKLVLWIMVEWDQSSTLNRIVGDPLRAGRNRKAEQSSTALDALIAKHLSFADVVEPFYGVQIAVFCGLHGDSSICAVARHGTATCAVAGQPLSLDSLCHLPLAASDLPVHLHLCSLSSALCNRELRLHLLFQNSGGT